MVAFLGMAKPLRSVADYDSHHSLKPEVHHPFGSGFDVLAHVIIKSQPQDLAVSWRAIGPVMCNYSAGIGRLYLVEGLGSVV